MGDQEDMRRQYDAAKERLKRVPWQTNTNPHTGLSTSDTQNSEVSIVVRNFFDDFATSISEKRLETLDDMYVREYPKLCDQLTKQRLGGSQKWPCLEEARPFLGDNHVTHLLYSELYYRHIFSRLDKQVMPEDRVASWENYCMIFDQFIQDMRNPAEAKLLTALPYSLLWDIVDEYLYQYLSHCQFKAKTIAKKAKSMLPSREGPVHQVEADYQVIKENPGCFDSTVVYDTLNRVINESGIDHFLKVQRGEIEAHKVGYLPTDQKLYLGYFVYMQKIRYHSIHGDYDEALKTADCLDLFSAKGLYYKSASCHLTFVYYVAFALFMQKRMSDCLGLISKTLFFLSKLHRLPTLHALYEKDGKTHQKLTRLLILCDVFAPDNFHAKVEPSVMATVQEQFGDEIKVLRTFGRADKPGEEENVKKAYEGKLIDWFNFVCPKFVSILTTLPETVTEENVPNPMFAHNHQWGEFWNVVENQKNVPNIRNHLRMYTKINLEKLTTLCRFSSQDLCKDHLYACRQQGMQLVMKETSRGVRIVPGEPQRCTDLDFTMDANGDITVSIVASPKNYTNLYLKGIQSLQEIAGQLQASLKVAAC